MTAPAYVIVTAKIVNPDAFQHYLALAPATVAAYGGAYVVRGGKKLPLEGPWEPSRVTVLRFPSMDQARAWYDSAAYAEARAHRDGATEYFNMLLVEGIEG